MSDIDRWHCYPCNHSYVPELAGFMCNKISGDAGDNMMMYGRTRAQSLIQCVCLELNHGPINRVPAYDDPCNYVGPDVARPTDFGDREEDSGGSWRGRTASGYG